MYHIQIILYNSIDFLSRLIAGLNVITQEGGLCVHFLENSEEDSLSFLKKQKSGFQYTYDNEKTNFGFGRGHNFLFNKYQKDYKGYFIILNPDIIPFFDFINKFEEFIKNLKNNKWGIIELTQFPEEHPKDYDREFNTEYASGAACVIKVSAFKKVKGFDNNIFMYAEDVDLSWRIKEEGFSILHCPDSFIAHTVGGSSKTYEQNQINDVSDFQQTHMFAGNLYLRFKFFGNKELHYYQNLIKTRPFYNQALNQFNDMKERLTKRELDRFRKYKSPKLYPDTNYGRHRW